MNPDSKEDLWLVDHLDKCRCCFDKFEHREKQVKITEIIKEQFLELTQIELLASPNFSNIVCMKCTNELQSISSFRLNLITKQQQLYEFVTTSQYQIQDAIKFEPVNIKIETQSFDDFVFDTQYEEIESPEVSVISKTTKTKKQFSTTKSDNQSPKKDSSERLRNRKTLKPKEVTKMQKKKAANKHSCSECKKVYNNSGNLANHIRLVHLTIKKACPQCGKFYKGSGSLRRHIRRVHLKQKYFFCDLCSYGAFFKNEMEVHMKVHLRKMINATKVENKPTLKERRKPILNKSMCPQCGSFVQNLLKHIRRVHLKQRHFLCDLCGYGAFLKNEIKKHMNTHLPEKVREKFFCDQCDFVTVTGQWMKFHVKNEHGSEVKEKVLSVCHCGKAFQSIEGLNRHKKYVHLKQKNHICKICGKAFESPSKLKMHMAFHSGKRDVACEVCGKMFVTVRQMKLHSIYHKDPEFICNFVGCTKKYYSGLHLEAHKKTHVDQRDFECQLCDKKYFKGNHLSRHVLNFHKQMKVSCELPGCSSKFARKETYRNHVLSNHKDLSQEKIQSLLKKIREMKHE